MQQWFLSLFFCSADHCHFLGIFIALAVEMMSSSAFTETISDKSVFVIGITDVFIKKTCFYKQIRGYYVPFTDC